MAKTITGTVVSNASDKSITISVDTRRSHPIYKKHYTVTKKFVAHDEKNEAGVGDKVEIEQTRPVSKRKSFKLVKVLEKAQELGS